MRTIKLKFKPLLVVLLLGTVLSGGASSFAQNLEGKWIMAKKDNKQSFLNMHLMQFTKDSLVNYDFDKRFSATTYHIKDNRINVDTASIGVFHFVNKDRFRLKPGRLDDSIDFVRLKPTKTKLSKPEIKKQDYLLNYQGRSLALNFGKVNKRGPSSRLEKIDQTYFVSLYRKNKRLGSWPVEAVTAKKLVLYGFPEKPYKATCKSTQ